MIWTIFAVIAVVGTKLITALRLKDLKAKVEVIQPKIEELRAKLAEAEDDLQNLKLKEEATQTKLTHLKGVVQYLGEHGEGAGGRNRPRTRRTPASA